MPISSEISRAVSKFYAQPLLPPNEGDIDYHQLVSPDVDACEPCSSKRVSALLTASVLITNGIPEAVHQFSSTSASLAEEGIWLLRSNAG